MSKGPLTFDRKITIKISKDMFERLDKKRGAITVSLFIRTLLERQLK